MCGQLELCTLTFSRLRRRRPNSWGSGSLAVKLHADNAAHNWVRGWVAGLDNTGVGLLRLPSAHIIG